MEESWVSRLSRAILGDPLDAGLVAKPISYEELHAEPQSILIPQTWAKGITVHLLQPLNKSFALQHKVGIVPGDVEETMMGPMPGPGHRVYSMAGVFTHRSQQGGKYRLAAQYDAGNGTGKGTLLADVWGNGRLRVQGQLFDHAQGDHTEWGVTATLRGDEQVLVARAKDGPEIGGSINRRLTPASPITLGGEVMVRAGERVDTRRKAAAAAAAAEKSKAAGAAAAKARGGKAGAAAAAPAAAKLPIEFAVGAAYDAGVHKTAVHLASTPAFPAVASVHHLLHVTARAQLAAKLMFNFKNFSTMASAGYRLHFRNTLTTLGASVDTYGKTVLTLEREPIKDLRVALFLDARLWPDGGPSSMGIKVTLGPPSPIAQPLSPLTMSRDIFGAN